MAATLESYCTPHEAGIILGRTPSSISRDIAAGRLPGTLRVGERQYLIPRRSVKQFTPPPRGNPNLLRNCHSDTIPE